MVDYILFLLLTYQRPILGGLFILIGISLLILILRKKRAPELVPVSNDIRYADPSHANQGWLKKGKTTSSKKKLTRKYTYRDYISLFSDSELLKNETIKFIRSKAKDGAYYDDINNYVALSILNHPNKVSQALSHKKVRDKLSFARKQLGKEEVIGYNRQQEVWYFKGNNDYTGRNLTEKEKRYLKNLGLDRDWTKIDDPLDAIKWMHKNFSFDDFEVFCTKILEHCEVQNCAVSEKRKSGADGGIDGEGELLINGKLEKVAIQAKRYRPDIPVGEDHIRNFAGSLQLKGFQYGFFITTSIFSDHSLKAFDVFNQKDDVHLSLEPIDKYRLIEIMLYKGKNPHGFGLFKTPEYGWFYMNKEILKRAVSGN